jgi:serine/threonine-protein phosphatase 4 regulatory subunit 1
VKKALLN